MKLEEIKRDLLTVPELSEGLLAFGKEAEEVLGYSALREFSERTPENLKPLQRVLAELQIDTLSDKDVEVYQASHMIEVAKAKFAEWCISNPNPSYGSFFSPIWRKQKIAEYKQPVPEFVLAKAVQIKKALPDVLIFIEYLEENPDPFLVVRMAENPAHAEWSFTESYYVEAWAEPKFEAKHT